MYINHLFHSQLDILLLRIIHIVMKTNIGNFDRTIRVLLGVIIIGIGIFTASWWGLIGVVLILTALIGYCPLYAPFGIFTNKKHHPTK